MAHPVRALIPQRFRGWLLQILLRPAEHRLSCVHSLGELEWEAFTLFWRCLTLALRSADL